MAQAFEPNSPEQMRSATPRSGQQSPRSRSSATHAEEERAESAGQPNQKLAKVFESKEESEAMVVRGLLESAGIETYMTSPEAPQDILPGIGGTIIFVREEQAEESREIIDACQDGDSGTLADQAEAAGERQPE